MAQRDRPAGLPLTGTVGTGAAPVDPELTEAAYRLARSRALLARQLPRGLVRNAAWDVLLELFIAEAEGRSVGMTEILQTTGETSSTTLRLIDRLEDLDLVERKSDARDRRRKTVRLSASGLAAMSEGLDSLPRGR